MGGRCCSDSNYFPNINRERVVYHSEYYIGFQYSYFHVEKNSNLGLKYNKNTKILITFIKWETQANEFCEIFKGKVFCRIPPSDSWKIKDIFPVNSKC